MILEDNTPASVLLPSWSDYTYYDLLVKHGYWFMRELGWFGEEFYIHSSMDQFDELMMQYKSTREKGPWGGSRPYLHHPVYVSPK